MKILLTGAFGNIGAHTLDALLARGYTVRCFDLDTRANRRAARRWAGRAEVLWGDLRRRGDVAEAVRGQDVVLHLAFVIPRLSATGVNSEDRPDWARQVNVGGTANLLSAMQHQPQAPAIIFTSSLHVFGRTQHQLPPRTVADPVNPVEHYAAHKVECERLVKASGLRWAILRLPATLPIRLILDRGMFDVPLENRVEYAHGKDVAAALANAVSCAEVWGRTLLIGGGERCQLIYRELVERVLSTAGIGMLPRRAFATTPYSIDWLDTAESQRLLCYQQRTLDDYVREMRQRLGRWRPLIRLFRPFIRAWLLAQSPAWAAAQRGA